MKKFSGCQNWDFWPVQPHCWMKLAEVLKIGLLELWQHQINQFQSLFRHSGQFWSFGAFFLSFLAIFGHFWPFWPQIQNCRRLVMWPLKMTAREAEIQWRWFRMSLFRHSGHFWSFGAFFGHFWPIFGPKFKIVLNWSCDYSKWLQEKQKSDKDGFGCHYSDI